jgi:Nucleotidyl transferase AbiEii toxin, Type IV TA system
MTSIETTLRTAASDLGAMKMRWALIGGWAVSLRSTPRFTKDLDFAIAIANAAAAEDTVLRLRGHGYTPVGVIEQEYVERLSGVRLERQGSEVIVDLLFASSGIEEEIVAGADRIRALPGLMIPVATRAHLIALKILANRDQDRADLRNLIRAASPGDLDAALAAARLITVRGFNRERDIVAELEQFIADMRRDGGSPR